MSEKYKIIIKPLTGIHIGSGEKLTPLDYKLADSLNDGDKKISFRTTKYLKFSSDKIIKKVIDSGNVKIQNEFEEAISSKDFKKLRYLLHANCTDLSDMEYPCEITPEFNSFFKNNMNKDPLDNATEVMQMYRPFAKKNPVLPGSSLKGAVRTAYLNYLLLNETEIDNDTYKNLKESARVKKQEDKRNTGDYIRQIEKRVLQINSSNTAQQDPFRCVEISDCVMPAKHQMIGSLSNVYIDNKTKELKSKSMQLFAELIPGSLLGVDVAAPFSMRIDNSLQTKENENFKINRKIKIADIAKACNYFFKKQFAAEYEKFYEEPAEHISKVLELKRIIDSIKEDDKNNFLVRVGRWSQVEYVTLGKDFRNPRVPVDRRTGREKGYGNTRILLDYNNQYIPMGWCLCSIGAINS